MATINGKKQGSVTYSTDRENEVSKILIMSLRLIWHTGKETSKFSWPYNEIRLAKLTITLRILTERYNKG